MSTAEFDLIVVGGGVNGCGIAADAAGRGLRVLLAEMADLASGTSSASSKLIHGGLRYLEHYEFRLVREALAERELLLGKAPHIVRPLRFILPHGPGLRPRWLLRAGLLLYDNLTRSRLLPRSAAIDLRRDPAARPLRADFVRGFSYWDCWVDDARLVVLNARAAADRGAEILTRAKLVAAERAGHFWLARIETATGVREVRGRALVNAGGPWSDEVAGTLRSPSGRRRPALRLVKGSHIVIPRLPGADVAYLLQNTDRRVVFALPFEERFTMIGTTDVAFSGDPGTVAIDADEEAYLLDVVSRFFATKMASGDVVWRFAGVRPLYDTAGDDLAALSRDYRLDLPATGPTPPLLTVLGGKVTSYRRLAEDAVDRLTPFLPRAGPRWTASAALPGGDMPRGDFEAFVSGLQRARAGFDPLFLRRLAQRHGSTVDFVLGNARTPDDLGEDLGAGLTEREVEHLRDWEWARTAEDVLWRRTKIGLHLDPFQRNRAETAIQRLLGSRPAITAC